MKSIVALGSNLGDRTENLRAGLKALAAMGRLTPSPLVLETPDESGIGPDYLNTVALLDSSHGDPTALLEELLRIELRLGRDRSAGRNAPRILDLDLVAAENHEGTCSWLSPPDLRCLGEELHLRLPHPRALGRPFVMEPLRALVALLPEGALDFSGLP